MTDKPSDAELMQHADGERELEVVGNGALDDGARGKLAAIGELGELVRGHLELSADEVAERRFAAVWREIDKRLEPSDEVSVVGDAPQKRSAWRRLSRWLDRYRGYVITGAVSAGAVATLALVLRGPGETGARNGGGAPIDVQPAALRPTEIQQLETPGGTSAVFHLHDEDGTATVIWVTPEDTVEGI